MVSEKSHQDSVNDMAGSHRRLDKMKQVVAQKWQGSETRMFYWHVFHVHLTMQARLMTPCMWLSTVSLPTHYIYDKICLRTLLISVTIVLVMWWTRGLVVFKWIFFPSENQQITKHISKDSSSGNPKATKITVASSAENNQFWQS